MNHRTPKNTGARRRFQEVDLFPYVLIMPLVVVIGVVVLYPIFQSIVMSFQSINLLRPMDGRPFIGFANYVKVLGDSAFWDSVRVTLSYTVWTTLLSYIFGLILALTLQFPFKGRGLARTAAILPYAFPPVVTSLVWMWMFDYQYGVINYLLRVFRIIKEPVGWLIDPGVALWSMILVTTWKSFPIAMLMLLAGLQGIPSDLYEASAIDGANWFQKFRHITLPSLRGVSNVLLLLLIIWNFRSVAYIYVMTGGGPSRATEVLAIRVYQMGFLFKDFGLAATHGTIMLIFSLGFTIIYSRFAVE